MNNIPHVVQDECMGGSVGVSVSSNTEILHDTSHFGTTLTSGGYGAGTAGAQQAERANALRGAQLQDLLRTQGMWRPTMPSSSSSRSQPNIFRERTTSAAEKSEERSDQQGLFVTTLEATILPQLQAHLRGARSYTAEVYTKPSRIFYAVKVEGSKIAGLCLFVKRKRRRWAIPSPARK